MFYDGQKYRELLDGDQKRVGIRCFNGKIAGKLLVRVIRWDFT